MRVVYSARFVARGSLSAADLEEHFRRRPRFSVVDGCGHYENEDTGVSFVVRLDPDRVLTLEIDVPRPPCFVTEAALELEASAAELELTPDEPPLDLESEYEDASSAALRALVDSGRDPVELSDRLLDVAWRWNFGRADMQRAAAPDVRVPPIEVVAHPESGRACLAVAWNGASPALVPDVDVIVLSEDAERVIWVDRADVAGELDALGVRSPRFRYESDGALRECGVRHFDATHGASISRDRARRVDQPLRRVALRDVASRELVRRILGVEPSEGKLPVAPAPSTFPDECGGFLRTRTLVLARVLGGYTWRSPWKLESIALSEPRGIVAGVGAGGTVFFDVRSGRRLCEVPGDVHAGVSIGISADGGTIAIGDEGGTLRVFDVQLEGNAAALEVRRMHAASSDGSPAYVLGVSPDGAVVVAGAGDSVFLLRDGEEPTSFRARGAVAVAPDLSRLWLGRELVDVTTEATLLDLGAHADAFRVPALSPDGQLLAFGTSAGDLCIVRLADGGILSLVRRKSVARTIVFSPDGRWIVVGDGGGIELRTVPSLEVVKSFPTPTWEAAVSADTIFRVADDRIWTQPLEGHAPPVNDGPINQLFHSARGPIAVASSVPGENGTGGRAVLWHLPSGEVLRATERLCPDRINLSPDGRLLMLVNEEALTVLDVGTLAEVAKIESLGSERYVRPLDLDAAPDNEHVLVCLEDGTVRMISTRTGRDAWKRDLGVRCATFTPDGSFVVGGDASRLRLIDARTGEVEHEIAVPDPRPNAEHVLILDGDLAARVIADTGIAIVDLVKETLLVTPWPRAHDVLAVSPDGRLVAFTSDEDHGTDLVLWESDSRREHDRLSLASAHDAPVSAAFSPDGKRLLVGTSLGALLVFERSDGDSPR